MEKKEIYLESRFSNEQLRKDLKDFKEVLDTLIEIYQPMVDTYNKIEKEIDKKRKKIVSVQVDYKVYDNVTDIDVRSIPIKSIAEAFAKVTKESNPEFSSQMSSIVEEQEKIYEKINKLIDKKERECEEIVDIAKETLWKAKKAFSDVHFPMNHAISCIERLLKREDNPERYNKLSEVVLKNIPLMEGSYLRKDEVPEGGYFC